MIINMEYQQIINLLESTTDQIPKCRTNIWIEINNDTKTSWK